MSHDFAKSLAASHAAEDLPFWREVYERAFPTMQTMLNHRDDGQHQRNGIDRSVILSNSKQILIDEKVRWRNSKTGVVYEDILLEFLSDRDANSPGWVCKPLLCDYIAYAIAPLGRCYLLPVLQLQAVWAKKKTEWLRRRHLPAENLYRGRRWVTLSVAVDPQELFPLIGQMLRVSFTEQEELPCVSS